MSIVLEPSLMEERKSTLTSMVCTLITGFADLFSHTVFTDVFQNECGDDSNDVDDLSAGSVAGMTAAIVLLISMPVGMAIGLYVARCVWRRGSRGPPSSFLRRGETGSQQKMDKYEEAIYEEPMQVISPINLNENQAYSLIGMQRRN